MAQSMLKKMKPLGTGKVTDEVYAIKDGFVNMYLIRCGDTYIAFDAGVHPENVKKELTSLGIGAGQVSMVFLTHSDSDHTGAISLFKDAVVCLTGQEVKLINGERSRFLFFGNSIKSDNLKLLEDNQVTNVNENLIRCILTPGHTIGSACYLVNDRYLFTGDCLRLVNGKVAEFYRLPNMDTETQKKSIEKLSHLSNIRYLFTAHDGMTSAVDSAFAGWRKK